MPLTIEADAGHTLRFRLDGADAVPRSDRWKSATPKQRLRYFPILAEVLLEKWHEQMLEGKGRKGNIRAAKPISRIPYTEAGLESSGPGLLPQNKLSRAYRLARVTAYADLGRVTGYWMAGFGKTLSYHHEGVAGKGRPYRDEAGRLRFAGIRGAVTGVVRDLMPSNATIKSAIEDAEREWAITVGLAGKKRGTGSTATARVTTGTGTTATGAGKAARKGARTEAKAPPPPPPPPPKKKPTPPRPSRPRYVVPAHLRAPWPLDAALDEAVGAWDDARTEAGFLGAAGRLESLRRRAREALAGIAEAIQAEPARVGPALALAALDALEAERRRWDSILAGLGAQLDAVARRYVASGARKAVETAQPHGAPQRHTFDAVRVGPINLLFPPGSEDRAAEQAARLAEATATVPRRLLEATRDIYLVEGANVRDDYWRRAYNNPDHVSAATGGDGRLVSYRPDADGGIADIRVIAHESGHNLATKLYGSTAPRPGSDFAAAISSGEPPPTNYGKNSDAEDFAESCRMYVESPDELRRIAPRRFAIVDKLMKDPSYGG